jgi:hypothetical protein
MLHRVALVRINVSEERISSIIRATGFGELGTLAVTGNRRRLPRNTIHTYRLFSPWWWRCCVPPKLRFLQESYRVRPCLRSTSTTKRRRQKSVPETFWSRCKTNRWTIFRNVTESWSLNFSWRWILILLSLESDVEGSGGNLQTFGRFLLSPTAWWRMPALNFEAADFAETWVAIRHPE